MHIVNNFIGPATRLCVFFARVGKCVNEINTAGFNFFST
jgi:hypothetical protein